MPRPKNGFSPDTVQSIRERDHDKCRRCGKGGAGGLFGMHTHHIIYKSQGGLGVESNGARLCNECHAAVHSEGRRAREILQIIVAAEAFLTWRQAERLWERENDNE